MIAIVGGLKFVVFGFGNDFFPFAFGFDIVKILLSLVEFGFKLLVLVLCRICWLFSFEFEFAHIDFCRWI